MENNSKFEYDPDKVFLIDGVEFVVRKKFTLNESKKLKKLCADVIVKGTTITGNFNNEEDFIRFMKMVLERKDGKPIDEKVDFGEIDDEESISLFISFFLGQGMKMVNLLTSLES